MNIKVMVVDDSRAMRAALCSTLESEGLEIVGQAKNGREAVELARKLQPDVILMDIKMPLMDGFEATRLIKKEFPHIKIIALTVYEEKEALEKAAARGFSAYIVKGESLTSVLGTIREVYAGKKYAEVPEKSQEFAELKELTEKLSALSVLVETSQRLAAARTREDVYSSTGKLISQIAGTNYLVIRGLNGQIFWSSPIFEDDTLFALSFFFPARLINGHTKKKQPKFFQSVDLIGNKQLSGLGFKSLMVCPLKTSSEFLGTLEFYYKSNVSISPHEKESLQTLANNIALTLEGVKLREDLEDLFYSTIRAFVSAIEAKEAYLKGHSEGVSQLAVRIGEKIGFSSKELDFLRLAGLLHDIGKIGVRDDILNKKGPLTLEERRKIQKHPIIGFKILQPVSSLSPAAEAVYHHHERWDGKGYPEKIKGKKIPVTARILGIADAFDAMTTQRIYRPALSFKEAKAEIIKNASFQFDPTLTKVFLEILEKNEFYQAY